MTKNANEPFAPISQPDDSSSFFIELDQALENHASSSVRAIIKNMHSADIAFYITGLSNHYRERFISFIRDNFAPEILLDLNDDLRQSVIEQLGGTLSAGAIAALSREEAVDVIDALDLSSQEEILEAVPEETRAHLEEDLAFPEQSAGRIANRNVLILPDKTSIKNVIKQLRSQPMLARETHYIYAVNSNNIPVGFISLAQILRHNQNHQLADIIRPHAATIPADMDQDDIAHLFRKYGFPSAPVVDKNGSMIGVITLRDIVFIVEEEAQEDILHLAGIQESDVHASVPETTKRRFTWLFINLLTAMLASWVITFFEPALEKFVALAVLMPIIASMGGNAGTQTVTVVVRALAKREINKANSKRMLLKEIQVGALNGILFAILLFFAALLAYQSLALSAILAGASIISLIAANFAGVLIPITLEKCGFDPAITSTVFLTTITDIVAFASFLGLASWWML
jgi:magnesium transporter